MGPQAARDIIAGTVIALGRTGADPGLGSKRGSIVACGGIDVPATYEYACTYEPPYVRLLMVYLSRTYGLQIGDEIVTGKYRRYCGDAGDPGKGEILKRI
jgi:formylmethanofuran dehydrogenase subunit C